ncbi:ABC1 kinase family protein [Streptomyces graminilatus]|uniref:ABC1 kinase family protein n=1 Tax=Streptomyces graminilatus TaxID=1464070 RepID=UPI0006E23B0B|nr:AarF/UbiB family protein [Streptomyces graminilatus]
MHNIRDIGIGTGTTCTGSDQRRLDRLLRGAAVRLTRFPTLALLGAGCAVAFLAALLLRPAACPRIVRVYFERAGGGVVKVGQLLATRYDLLPPAYCEELARLLDGLRPVPAERIRGRVEASLGRRVEELFAEFEDEPLGTASLAQVHGAVLRSGEPVVVKVLKPGVARLVTMDMWFVRAVARLLDRVPPFMDLRIGTAARELSRLAVAELDLEREATHLSFFHTALAGDELPHHAPAPYRHLCSAEVLTMERINGVTVRQILSALHHDDRERLTAWAQRGITAQGVARLVFRSVLEQSTRHRMFNADPHPSNLIVSDGGRLNWIDFGLVGWMDERQWSLQLRLRRAFVRGEVHGAYRLFLESVGPLPGRDLRSFEAEMKEAIRSYIVAARDPGTPMNRRSTGAFLMSTLGALRRHRLPMSTDVMQLYRAILVADMVMLRLDPGIDWLSEMDDFLVRYVAEQTQETIRAGAQDPSGLAALLSAPSTMTAGWEWLDLRLLLGPERAAPPPPSAANELAHGLVRLVLLTGLAALAAVLALAVGLVTAPGWPVAVWVTDHWVRALTLLAATNVVLRQWARRFVG